MTIQPPFGMIADDLTGACDAGVQFASRGFSSMVWLKEPDAAAEMTVLTTASRADAPAVARAKVREACRILRERGIRLVYKKIDSTLAGSVAEEIEAALEATGRSEAWISPAFPAMGRTVAHGRLIVHGVERGRVPASGRLLVRDASTPEDLERIAREALALEPQPLAAGSAGLAAALAAALARLLGKSVDPGRRSKGSGPVVCLTGSRNPVTCAQVERLRQARPEVRVVEVSREHPDAERVRRLLPAGALILCGGDTAEFACRVLGVSAIRLEDEVLTGIPSGRLQGGDADGLPVVTKAGGFGDETALVRIVDYLEASCSR